MSKENTACFTGHRPDKLGNAYGFKHPTILLMKEKLLTVLEDLIVNYNVTDFISGGALGGDITFFYCVTILKKKYPNIKNIVAVPFKKQPYAWKKKECKECLYVGSKSAFLKGEEYSKCNNCTFRETQYWYEKMLSLADEVIYVDMEEGYNKDTRVAVGDYSGFKMQLRNNSMVDKSSHVVTVWDGNKSGGTYNCIEYAILKSKTIHHLNPRKNFEYLLL